MTANLKPFLAPTQQVVGDWHILPSWLPIPDIGLLPVNAFLLAGQEPMLVDTGLAELSADFLAAIEDLVPISDLEWIWLSHTDADHIGNLGKILEAAPRAKVITNFLGAGKMNMLGFREPDRLHFLPLGEFLDVGGHVLRPVRPPYYDAPETMGFFDQRDGVLFIADAFGATLQEPAMSVCEIAEDCLRDGLKGWSSIDAPWLELVDNDKFASELNALAALAPKVVLSGHLPIARDFATLSKLAGAMIVECSEAGTGKGRSNFGALGNV